MIRQVLPASFFQRSAEVVAPALLGAIVVSRLGGRVTAGRIVEAEAYLGAGDPASHGFQLRRHAHNEALYGPPGTWYVYRSYGIHWCINLVCAPEGKGGAVLIRALEPTEGLSHMGRRRGPARERPQDLCSGPGKLSQALGVTLRINGRRMWESSLLVCQGNGVREDLILRTPRVGITRAKDWPLRFAVTGSPWASRPRPGPDLPSTRRRSPLPASFPG